LSDRSQQQQLAEKHVCYRHLQTEVHCFIEELANHPNSKLNYALIKYLLSGVSLM